MSDICHVIKNEPDDSVNYLNLFDLSKSDVISNSSLVWKEEPLEEQNNSSPSSGSILKEEMQEYKKYSCKTGNFDENYSVIPENITVKVETDVEEYNELEVPFKEKRTDEDNSGYEFIVLKTLDGKNEPDFIYPENINSNRNKQLNNNIKLFQCDSCPYKTKCRSYMVQHLNRNHITDSKLFKCHICPYESQVKENLKRHLDHNHKKHIQLFKCDSCSYETKRRDYFCRHFNYKHREYTKLLKCNSCTYETKVKGYLKRHINRNHRGNIEFLKCDICPYKTRRKSNLLAHVDRNHKEHTELLKCDGCAYETTIKEYLQRHINRNHIRSSEFLKCTISLYETKTETSLNRHMKNNHKAPTLAESDRERHINKGHKAQAESNKNESNIFLKCDICPYATTIKTSFNKHRHKHSLESVLTANS